MLFYLRNDSCIDEKLRMYIYVQYKATKFRSLVQKTNKKINLTINFKG